MENMSNKFFKLIEFDYKYWVSNIQFMLEH